MTRLIVPNQADSVTQPSELEQRLSSDIVTTRYSVRFQANRGSGNEQALEVENTDVVELEMDDGQKMWIRVDDLERDLGIALNRSDNETGNETGNDVLRIPSSIPAARSHRGVGEWVIKGLKVLGVDIAGSIKDFVVGKVEAKQTPGPGLYQCSAASVDSLSALESIDRSKPILVFIHGTASSTQSSFGAFWQSGGNHVVELLSHYENQVLAFQHSSLSESPVENALQLLKALLKLKSTVVGKFPLRLHLVSHSRGGLIGELLCRGTRDNAQAFDADDIKLFSKKQYARDRKAIVELGALLDKTDIQIERFMRVACPARGTTLADGRLDRYLSGLVNILDKIPGVSNPVFDGLSTLLLGVVHKRTEPEELPGLEAMMPVSPTIRLLNRPDIMVNADLHVIGGDVQGSGFLNRLKVMMTDLFYRDDHDLVVNTPSMLGGAGRTSGIRYWIDTGARVNHFRYFENSSTASRLSAGLLQQETTVFRTLNTEPHDVSAEDYRKRSFDPQPIVFVLPGIMGSHLAYEGQRIWLDFFQMALGGISKLDMRKSGDRVEPQEPIGEGYGELIKYLAASHDVRPFAYDWRESIRITAKRLVMTMNAAQEEAAATDQPVRIIAHSMGGLIVRAMLATPEGQTLWRRMSAHPGSRFVMLGTPNGGSHSIASMLMGRDSLVSKLALLDMKNDYAQLMKTVVGFDGSLQLLPHAGSMDLYERSSWEKLHKHDVPEKRGVFDSEVAGSKSAGIGWSIPSQKQLDEAAIMRDRIASSPIDAERMFYVAGVAALTPSDVTVNQRAAAGRQVEIHAVSEGDGRVTWKSGIPTDMPARNVYYMDAVHGDMAANVDAFPALLQLLEDGATRQLSSAPIVSRGTQGGTVVLPPIAPEMYPDRADIVAAAMGGSRRQQRVPMNKCHVRIVHGDLARSRFPVAVGHYRGDTIVSAEDYLDRQLGGRLRERHRLGIYPGKKGTSTILLNWPDQYERNRHNDPVHPGAIVVGLGGVGDLTPGALTSTLIDGLMKYALEVRDHAIENSRETGAELPATLDAPLTSLLISASNDLSVSDSLRSILRAVSMVNQRLQPTMAEGDGVIAEHSEPLVRISELDIVEYWEDKAIQATRALVALAASKEITRDFQIHRQVAEGKDGRRRVSFDDNAGWWQRLRISAQDNGELKFESLTERARVESHLQPTQRKLVDRFLARAAASVSYDSSVGKTLFELLTPNQLKQYAPDRRDLILMLDDKAAAYPWELMQDSSDTSGRPLAVEAGVVRQLISGKFRQHPLMSQSLSALVIGDPVADNDDGAHFPPLPGAAKEAQQVAAQLDAAAYQTTSLIGTDARAMDVVSALYAQPYRIMHIAAHGVFNCPVDDEGRPLTAREIEKAGENNRLKRVSGVVLGDGIYLTPSEFEQMRNVPELVFINCCHLGKHADGSKANVFEYHQLAANVATQLIRMGVRAVVAAGWAVDDDAAKQFARVFYERLLSNHRFGDSIAAARREVYDTELRRNGSTWGAYQCYGDPDFSLQAGSSQSRAGGTPVPLSPSEFRQELEMMAKTASYASDKRRIGMHKDLLQWVKVIPAEWFDYGSVCSAVAKAFAELGDLEQAANYYQQANASDRADASISSLEQLASMKARRAMELDKAGQASKEERKLAEHELASAEKIINSLIQINGSQERHSIKGSVFKRKAMLADKKSQQSDLQNMADAYDTAYELAVEKNLANAFYPLQNRVAARIALSWCAGIAKRPVRKEITNDLARLGQYLDDIDMRDADFWMACQKADWRLLCALDNKILSAREIPEIQDAYLAARLRGGTEREFQSVGDHLRFFQRVAYLQLKSGPQSEKLVAGIESLLDKLKL